MISALVRKELRELLPIIVIASLVQLYLVGSFIGIPLGPFNFFAVNPVREVPFADSDGLWMVFLVAGVLTAGIGLLQTIRESRRGTFPFLLHRPMPRRTIFATKLAVGCVVCLLITVLPVLWYALWAATPGTHASPFQWSMTLWAWGLCSIMPLVYFSAFLSGLRPARWFGSRLFPLVGTPVLFGLTMAIVNLFSTWMIVQFIALVAIYASVVFVIFEVARTRDYS